MRNRLDALWNVFRDFEMELESMKLFLDAGVEVGEDVKGCIEALGGGSKGLEGTSRVLQRTGEEKRALGLYIKKREASPA